MLQRVWAWYFWGAAPCPYQTRRSRFRCWLWWHTHPRWLGEVRTALMAYHAMQEAARSRSTHPAP